MSPFHLAIDYQEFLIAHTDWKDDQHIRLMTARCTATLLATTTAGALVPDVLEFMVREGNTFEPNRSWGQFLCELRSLTHKGLIQATEFMVDCDVNDVAKVSDGFERYNKRDIVMNVVNFIGLQKFFCRLHDMAWLIPLATYYKNLIKLVSYAAVTLAELMNDPVKPFQPDCIDIGNSWFHRLGVYLLYLCSEHKMPPPRYLIELMALVTGPPSSSAKLGKAARMFGELEPGQYPLLLHESPPVVAVGTQLALELLGEFDANRQPEYFHRLQRAVACYAHDLLFGGQRPSARRLQNQSGMSWADAKAATELPSFSRMVFAYQCRYMMAANHHETCPECRERSERLNGLKATPRKPSSEPPSSRR